MQPLKLLTGLPYILAQTTIKIDSQKPATLEPTVYKELNEQYNWPCTMNDLSSFEGFENKKINQVWLYDNKDLSGGFMSKLECDDTYPLENNNNSSTLSSDQQPIITEPYQSCPICQKGFPIETNRIGDYSYYHTLSTEVGPISKADWVKSDNTVPTLILRIYKKNTNDDIDFPNDDLRSNEKPMGSKNSFCQLSNASPPKNKESPLQITIEDDGTNTMGSPTDGPEELPLELEVNSVEVTDGDDFEMTGSKNYKLSYLVKNTKGKEGREIVIKCSVELDNHPSQTETIFKTKKLSIGDYISEGKPDIPAITRDKSTVKHGEEFTIECTANGSPTPQVSFYDGESKENTQLLAGPSDYNAKYTVTADINLHHKKIMCLANNDNGEVSEIYENLILRDISEIEENLEEKSSPKPKILGEEIKCMAKVNPAPEDRFQIVYKSSLDSTDESAVRSNDTKVEYTMETAEAVISYSPSKVGIYSCVYVNLEEGGSYTTLSSFKVESLTTSQILDILTKPLTFIIVGVVVLFLLILLIVVKKCQSVATPENENAAAEKGEANSMRAAETNCDSTTVANSSGRDFEKNNTSREQEQSELDGNNESTPLNPEKK